MYSTSRCERFWPIVLCCTALLAGCDSFDEERAALVIRDRICREWPYGCSDSTRVVVEDVNKTSNGRQVEFRLVDRADATPRLSAAYFEPQGEEWAFLLFEDPFKSVYRELAGRVDADTRHLTDVLSEIKAAQRWFNSIYGRYAGSLSELDSVSYTRSEVPIELTVGEGFDSWKAEASTRYVHCQLEMPGQQLPRCEGLTADFAGSDSGPLSRSFAAVEQ